ncbi:ROK family protein [Acuticoccus sp. MNP-M23]|uniref:ROK family protein n=1 Tax=Acuticoccus sp. MNP-M23 TaxID=3072793 RepID=UPI0028164C9E|nr:ROK family protein [Acuticoccus sp. MNP-M23]WMS41444.1 ROK family protein [Acuticoccus sp. MNP-M23]
MTPTLLGIDIGGTKTAFVLGAADGTVIARHQIASGAERGYAPMLADICREAALLLAAHPSVAAVGAAVGGPLDAVAGRVLGPPHLPGWDDVPLAADLAALGRPARIEHDAKAGALAEWRFGAGRGSDDMVFLTLGTGIGAGIISGGRLLRGRANLAGEIGHWRALPDGPAFYGKAGSLEGIASGAGIAAHASWGWPATLGTVADAKALKDRADTGDADAVAAIEAAGTALGSAAARLIDLLAPERIVLGSLAQRMGPAFTRPMHAAIAREALPVSLAGCTVVDGAFGPAIGDVAALSVALTALETSS